MAGASVTESSLKSPLSSSNLSLTGRSYFLDFSILRLYLLSGPGVSVDLSTLSFSICPLNSLLLNIDPETAGRSLEEMDILFATDYLRVSKSEKVLSRVRDENPDLYEAARKGDIAALHASLALARADGDNAEAKFTPTTTFLERSGGSSFVNDNRASSVRVDRLSEDGTTPNLMTRAG